MLTAIARHHSYPTTTPRLTLAALLTLTASLLLACGVGLRTFGKVTDCSTELPLADVEVTTKTKSVVRGWGTDDRDDRVTDASGAFAMSYHPDATEAVLTFNKAGYTAQSQRVVNDAATSNVCLQPVSDTDDDPVSDTDGGVSEEPQ